MKNAGNRSDINAVRRMVANNIPATKIAQTLKIKLPWIEREVANSDKPLASDPKTSDQALSGISSAATEKAEVRTSTPDTVGSIDSEDEPSDPTAQQDFQ